MRRHVVNKKTQDPSPPKGHVFGVTSWAHYRQGVALQCMGRHAEALAAFATALAQDEKSPQLLNTLLDAALKSPLKDSLQPTCDQLKTMRLDKSPFVMISLIGQELLSLNYLQAAVGCLEAALKIGTCGLKLRGSVISALSTAYWKMGNVTKAMEYMKQDLETSQSLGDKVGECRAHRNLGGACYSQRLHHEATEHYRMQFAIAMKIKDLHSAALALSSLGHVYVAVNDYSNALASHRQASQLYKEMGERLSEGRELGNIGAVHVLLLQYDQAIHCHQEHLKIAVELGDSAEEGRAYSNLGSAYHCKRDYSKAIQFHKLVQDIAKKTNDLSMETRAYAGLGHAYRFKGDLDEARNFHELQLEVSVQLKDRATEGRALSNLGIIFQQQGVYARALKLHKGHLAVCKELEDRAGQGRAYGNMGCAYSALRRYDQAVKFHKQELLISKEVNDRASEACTHGNLAVAYQALGSQAKALKHYQQHLLVAQELKDKMNESVALSNLGNFYSSCGEFTNAVPYYEKFLNVTRQLGDHAGECKACHNLGFAHFSLGNHSEAVKFYERNVALAKDLDDHTSLARAYCNFGLAFSALGNYDRALECQREFLVISQNLKDIQGIIKAHGNIGDIYMNLGNATLAVEEYEEQLKFAESLGDLSLMGDACGTLGSAYRTAEEPSKALDCHKRELDLRNRSDDALAACRALGNLGLDYMEMGRHNDAHACFNDQLNKASDIGDAALEAQSCGNLGLCKLKTGDYHEALGYFEHQLATLERLPGALLDSGRAYGKRGECYHLLGDSNEAIRDYEKYLAAAQQAESAYDQDKAYRGLGVALKTTGNLQQALVCFEKRLVVAYELTDLSSKAAAYGELGTLHKALGNYEQAIAFFEQQLSLAKECSDRENEIEALSGLGIVNQKMGEYSKALRHHEEELRLATELRNQKSQARAYHNLGMTHELLGNYEQAIVCQEQNLNLASHMGDRLAKTQAYSCLGRTYHALENYPHAISFLKQGLAIAEVLKRTEDEARMRHRLGMSYLANKQLEAAQEELYHAADLLERIREEGIRNGDYKLSLYELQSACYQVLQRVMVGLGRHEEALTVAERARSRDFIDLLLQRQGGANISGDLTSSLNNPLGSTEQIMNFVKNQKATILYYSIAAGHLYSWLLTPKSGLVKFHDSLVGEDDAEESAVDLEQSTSGIYSHAATLLDSYITHLRDALGVKPHLNLKRATSMTDGDIESTLQGDSMLGLSTSLRSYVSADEDDDVMSVVSAPGGRPSMASTPRNNILSMRNSVSKLNGVRSSAKKNWSGKPPLRALYELLIAPMEDSLPSSSTFENEGSELVLVLQGDLYLVPFAVLKGTVSKESMFRRFRLMVVPSLQALYSSKKASRETDFSKIDPSSVLIVGNPKVPSTFGQWSSNPSAEHEAKIVADLFMAKPLLGNSASKTEILRRLPTAECVHFATHVSWKLTAVILSPSTSDNKLTTTASTDSGNEGFDFLGDTDDAPPLSDFLLTAADVLEQKTSAKIVVIGAAHNDSQSVRNRITSEGLVGLTRAFLSSGAQCVLVSLWPVPDLACKLLMKAFYGGLLKGLSASHALSQAMNVVQKTKQFSHPSNWAGFVLVGDTAIASREAMMGHAYALLLNNPKSVREALKVLVHLIDKASERIRRGQRSSMYTAEASIDAKVKGVRGWRELLRSVGFRFQKAKNGLPDSVFFPTATTSLSDRLSKASEDLYALLGLSPTTLQALAKLAYATATNRALVSLLNKVLSCFYNNTASVQVPLQLKLWRTDGCHELLASLGFDVIGVGKEEVMLRSGKLNSRRAVQCTVRALCALADISNPEEADQPSFKLMPKAHSSSTINSNVSLVAHSIGSELDMRAKSAEDLNHINRERRVLSGPNTRSQSTANLRPRLHGSYSALLRSSGDLRVSSVDAIDSPASKSIPQDTPAHYRRTRGSHANLSNVSRRSSQRSVSSVDISGLRVSSVDSPSSGPPPPNGASEEHHSDSDVDSYSDIKEQQRNVGLHGSSETLSHDDAGKTPGSISSLRTRQPAQDIQPGGSILKTAVSNHTSGSRTGMSNHMGYRIGELTNGDLDTHISPMSPRTSFLDLSRTSDGRSVAREVHPEEPALDHTRSKGPIANGDVRQPTTPRKTYSVVYQGNKDDAIPVRVTSMSRTDHDRVDNYSPTDDTYSRSSTLQSRADLRRGIDYAKTNDVARSSRTVSESRGGDYSSMDDQRLTDDGYYSKDSYANHLRSLSSSSNELAPKPHIPAKPQAPHKQRVVVSAKVANHKLNGRPPNMGVQISPSNTRTDSLSSQDSASAESPRSRQIAAEEAAAALIYNHTGSPRSDSRSSPSSSKLARQNVAMKELRQSGKGGKIKNVANLAHLQSSSC
ncbi:tetratricopeptide repeat protein 28 isoform X2 [Nematostella vectensis]|uniref:tetratricopeptide repeat protein 28 isoform X2 n=1 Tax=Nematostella vectensis TaxID=45351 RepID=UPI00207771FB|nr:tetratricopeptide repeat protein 28 isoform X2 [Nematostella vectensis]